MNTTAAMDFTTVSYQDRSQFKKYENKEGNGTASSVSEIDKIAKDLFTTIKGVLKTEEQTKYKGVQIILVDRLSEDLSHWVDSVLLPEKWISEGIHPPTIECKNLAKDIVLRLYKEFSVFPIRISATVEEGIFIKYINHKNKKELSVEIYNDLDIAAIITRGKEIITSVDIQDISDEYFSEIIRVFYEK